MIIFIDFIVIIFILVMIIGLGYAIISNLINIVFAIVIMIIEIVIIFLLLKVLNKIFPKTGVFLWFMLVMLMFVGAIVGAYYMYYAHRIYVTKQDIIIVEHDTNYTYWSDEDKQQDGEELESEVLITIPSGTELQTKSLQHGIHGIPDPDEMEEFIYNGKEIDLPNRLVDLIGEKPIWGETKYY